MKKIVDKFEKVFNTLASIDLQQYGKDGLDPFDETPLGPLYACDCYRNEFDILREIFYSLRWHDMNENPKTTDYYLVKRYDGENYSYNTEFYSTRHGWIKLANEEQVVSWMYTEDGENF